MTITGLHASPYSYPRILLSAYPQCAGMPKREACWREPSPCGPAPARLAAALRQSTGRAAASENRPPPLRHGDASSATARPKPGRIRALSTRWCRSSVRTRSTPGRQTDPAAFHARYLSQQRGRTARTGRQLFRCKFRPVSRTPIRRLSFERRGPLSVLQAIQVQLLPAIRAPAGPTTEIVGAT